VSSRHKSRTKRRVTMAGAGILAAVAAAATVTVASASQEYPEPAKAQAGHTVFVQGNELAGNTIHAFKRAADGKLTAAGTYATGGLGGSQTDAPTDSLASQGSLVLDRRSKLLLAVNAGSNTVTTFHAAGQQVLCWLERAGKFFFGGNTGNSTVSGYVQSKHGKLALTNEAGIATAPSPDSQGVIDLAVTRDNKFLYVQNATSGTIDGFRISSRGTLTKVNTTTGLPAFGKSGMEGIVAD
jgi:hypothetical protein